MKQKTYLAEKKLAPLIYKDDEFKKKYETIKKYAQKRGMKLFAVINEVFDYYINNVIKGE